MRPLSSDWVTRTSPPEYDVALEKKRNRIEAKLLAKPTEWTTIQTRLKHYKRSKEPLPNAARWTVGMVFAWIIWRNSGYVREYVSREKANRLRMLLEWSDDTISGVRTRTDLETATQLLFDAAIAGRLKFRGLSGTGEPQDIDPADWQYISRNSDNCNVLIWEKKRTTAFTDATCEARTVMELWTDAGALYRPVYSAVYAKPLNERERIMRAVENGEMSPDQGESLAQKKGLGPLLAWPDSTNFGHMNDVFWSIEVAVAWIIWREAGEVAKYHSPYREKCFVWQLVTKPGMLQNFGHRLVSLAPANLALLRDDFSWYEQVTLHETGSISWKLTFDEALGALLKELQSGGIAAYALDLEKGRPSTVSAEQWSYLLPSNDPGEPTTFKIDPAGASIYTGVKLNRIDVLRLWSINSSEVAVQAPVSKRGRKPKYDNEAFVLEAIRFIEYHGGFNAGLDPGFTPASVARHMDNWCEAMWKDDAPQETWRKKYVAEAIKRYQQGH